MVEKVAAFVPFMFTNHRDKQFELFSKMRDKEALVDCTLIAGSHSGLFNHFRAHKIILCANSQYIQNLFFGSDGEENRCDIISLPTISPRNLGFILDFIYKGETNVPMSHVTSFLESARFLQISGIFDKEIVESKEPFVAPRPKKKVSKKPEIPLIVISDDSDDENMPQTESISVDDVDISNNIGHMREYFKVKSTGGICHGNINFIIKSGLALTGRP